MDSNGAATIVAEVMMEQTTKQTDLNPYVVALLDCPSERSFAVVPFVVTGHNGNFRIVGLSKTLDSFSPLSADTLQQAIQDGNVLQVAGVELTALSPGLIAGWVGSKFLSEAGALPRGVPEKKLIPVGTVGYFWIDECFRIQLIHRDWITDTARKVFATGDGRLAELMIWADPICDETRAAVWTTRASEEEKQKRMQWWISVTLDAGNTITEDALLKRFSAVRKKLGEADA